MIASSALALLAATQAVVGLDDASCVFDGLSAAERSTLSAAAQVNRDPPQAVGERLESLTEACGQARGWSPDAAGNAVALALSMVIIDDAGESLARGGVDPEMIEAWFERQPDAQRTNMEISPQDGERIIEALMQAGVPLSTLNAQGERIGAYVAALIMIERIVRGLPIG